MLLGREAMGEAARNAMLRDNWRIRRNGRLIHAEATRLSADPHASATALSLLDGAARLRHRALRRSRRPSASSPLIRALLPTSRIGGASLIGERLVVRAIAKSGLALAPASSRQLSQLLSGAGALPRLWHL